MVDPRLLKREARQQAFIEKLVAVDGVVTDALAATGISRHTYNDWRARSKRFADRVETVKVEAKSLAKVKAEASHVFDPGREYPALPSTVDFRRLYLGRPTWPHQLHIAEAWDDLTNLVVLVFEPPGAGKDTLAGDVVLRGVAQSRVELERRRVAWIMEAETHAIRRGRRLKSYLTDRSVYEVAPKGPGCSIPERSLIGDYGPFEWTPELVFPDGEKVPKKSWSANEVYFVGVGDLEADPDLWFAGITGATYGARIDDLVLSDPFTVENQYSPTERQKQLDRLDGTLMSRLDEAGRLLLINTRVAPWDNGGVLLDKWTEDARVVDQSDDGYYTKFDNGVATVIVPAVQFDADGGEVSYWPQRFPMDDYLEERGGQVHLVDELSSEDFKVLVAAGAKRKRGLRSIRSRTPRMFATMYQQSPPSSDEGEFTDALLDHAEDPARSFEVWDREREVKILGIDPARTGGAAWALLAGNLDTGECWLMDYFYGERLGVGGLREKLLVAPISRWWPHYTVYEKNREESVLEHPAVLEVVDTTKTDLDRHYTGPNRALGEVSVASMAIDMRDGLLKFPAASSRDRERLVPVKQQFKNWDERTLTEGRLASSRYGGLPDDIVMAIWVAWVKFKSLRKRKVRQKKTVMQVPEAVRRKWRGPESKLSVAAPVNTDLQGLWHEQ